MICEEMITKKLMQDHRDTEDRPHASKGRRHGRNKKTIVVDAARGAQANQSDRVEDEGAVSRSVFSRSAPKAHRGLLPEQHSGVKDLDGCGLKVDGPQKLRARAAGARGPWRRRSTEIPA